MVRAQVNGAQVQADVWLLPLWDMEDLPVCHLLHFPAAAP